MKNISFVLVLVLSFTVAVAAASTLPQPEKLSKQQLQTLIATAKTPAEHERIAHYYSSKAQNLMLESKEHAQMAAEFKQNAVTASPKWSAGTVNHCQYLAQSLSLQAAKMDKLAKDHQQMAHRAGGR